VRYVVADTGPGIAEANLPHIFDLYWSAPGQTKDGLGLGLFISKGIIEAHGGKMSAESVLGCGATFLVTLPVAKR
jgi:signal transduction histidine kinase